jgi:hypothetical protein
MVWPAADEMAQRADESNQMREADYQFDVNFA